MKHRTDTRFDGLWPDERLVSWHIPVRCRSGFDGQLPLPKDFVPDADAVAAIVQALDNADCHVVALVGAAGTGKTTALGWLLRSLEQNNKDLNATAFRCSARTGGELQEFLAQASRLDQPRIYIVDGFDELRAENPGSLDELLQPILSHLLDGRARIVFSVRPDAGRSLLVLPAENLLNTREWGDAWAGVETSAGLRVAILQLQELRQRDVELYAMRRKLSLDFVVHLRSLYDIRELVRRFFLLVKLCDLSEQLPSEIWKQIRARDELYERLLTTWLTAERERDPYKLPLLADDLLSLLEWAALYVDKWTKNGDESLITRLGDTIRDVCESDRLGTYQYAIATALVNANIVTQVGFAHTSIEEYLLARALANLVRMNETKPLAPARITDDVIGFLAENKTFRDWLDQNQDRLTNINSDYLSYLVRLFHRQGRAVSNLDLHGANLSKLQLPGIRLKGADLRDANLEGTQFGPADLTGADLRGTDLRNAAIWTAQGASEMYASADGPDRVWLIHPSANRPLGVGMLIQLGFNGGRIAVSHLYDPRSERPYSDGLSLYLTPLALQRANVEVMQWRGENIANESWSLWPSATALASATLPGAVWQIRADRADLYNDDVLLQSFPHNNGSVRGVLAVPHTSEFIRHQVDGFCLIGAKLLALNRDAHIVIGEDIAFHQQMHQVATVGETRIIFRTSAGWFAWAPGDERSSHLPELADISRVIALSGGGYALVRPGALEFVNENLVAVARQEAKINPAYYIVGIKRERRRAIVILEPQGLRILDESTGAETVDWLRMRASGARFNKTTKLSNELRAALTSAGASNESLIPTAPLLENATTQHSQFAQLRFDVLLITVNQHEFDAVCAVAQEYFGKMPSPFPKEGELISILAWLKVCGSEWCAHKWEALSREQLRQQLCRLCTKYSLAAS